MLGDYMVGRVLMLWPVKFCYGGVWKSSGRHFV